MTLDCWPSWQVRDARAAWPEATDAQLDAVLLLAEHYAAKGGRWVFCVAVAVNTVRGEVVRAGS